MGGVLQLLKKGVRTTLGVTFPCWGSTVCGC